MINLYLFTRGFAFEENRVVIFSSLFVLMVNVNFSLGEVSFTLQKNNSLNYVISLIEKIGYKVKNINRLHRNKLAKFKDHIGWRQDTL